MIVQIVNEAITSVVQPIVTAVFATVVGIILTFIMVKWNKFVRGKTILQNLEIDSHLEQAFESKVVQGLRFVVEEERKQIKVDPNFKFAGEEKLDMVLDFLGGDKAIVDWLNSTGKIAANEVTHYLQKYRYQIEELPAKLAAEVPPVAMSTKLVLEPVTEVSTRSPNEAIKATQVPPEPMGPAF